MKLSTRRVVSLLLVWASVVPVLGITAELNGFIWLSWVLLAMYLIVPFLSVAAYLWVKNDG